MTRRASKILSFVPGLLLLCNCFDTPGPAYLDEGPEFSFELAHSNTVQDILPYFRSISFQGTFLEKTADEYRFFDESHDDTISLKLFGLGEDVLLSAGTIYQVIGERGASWQPTYGLIIRRKGDLWFEGISDGNLRRWISIYDSSAIAVTVSRVLNNRVRVTKLCDNKLTNMEIQFTTDGDSIYLVQGQRAILKDWEISLGLARRVVLSGQCSDSDMNGLSFTIIRQ